MDDYQGKTVIVTGGAGHIGKAITKAYLTAGANVIICGRTQPQQAVESAGLKAEFMTIDIRDHEQATRLITSVADKYGGLDILVNNAGGSPPIDSATASPGLTDKIIQLNLVAPLVLSQLAFNVMAKKQTVGNIINIASVSGVRPSPGTSAYGAAKAGLLSATKSLAQEWGPRVRVNAVIVGLVRHDAGVEHYGGAKGFAQVADMLPLKRMAEPEDIANACLYLSSEQAAYISGATLEVDGGGEVPVFLHLTKNNQNQT